LSVPSSIVAFIVALLCAVLPGAVLHKRAWPAR